LKVAKGYEYGDIEDDLTMRKIYKSINMKRKGSVKVKGR